MTSSASPKYRMTLSLSVLKHLGFGLYSNVPAVLSEAVANAWDADAEKVRIRIYPDGGEITIQDDGHGMDVDDANNKYLTMGYERRKDSGGAVTPKFGRPVMGRKGIGKLSLFSIAKTVEVHSVKGGARHGFVMDADSIEDTIKNGDGEEYHPQEVPAGRVSLDRGTLITLTNLMRQRISSAYLRRRLARRFSVIAPGNSFEIILDGDPIQVGDRDYYDKLQYMWTFGELGQKAAQSAKLVVNPESRPAKLNIGNQEVEIGGWIGTAAKAGDLKERDTNESINKIVVMVRGKLAQEDILQEFREPGVYSQYIIGEVHADFLDLDEEEDIATTSRQRIVEDDDRYRGLKKKLQEELKFIQSEWTNRRNADGRKEAEQIPQVKDWLAGLNNSDHSKAADKLLGRINQLPIDNEVEKRRLLVSGILAFESFKFRNLLKRIEGVSVENMGALREVFTQLDDLEASAYYQIAKDRLQVIEKLANLVDENAKERALQEHLYQHLWLLDPSWERATATVRMEQRIKTALGSVSNSLSEEQTRKRLDIYYATTGKKHVIIELKRAGLLFNTAELLGQVIYYRGAALRVLRDLGMEGEPLEFVCVVGKRLRDWDEHTTGETDSRRSFDGQNARVVMYDQLISNAQEAYRDYLEKSEEAGRVYRLITSIEAEDAEAIHSDTN